MIVKWTKEALKDLEEIEDYIAQDNLERAYTFIYEISTNEVIIHEVHNFSKMVRHFNT